MTTPEPLPDPFIPLHSTAATLRAVGGKALNLARLAQAGFPVPNGFFIPTSCYRDFVTSNELSSSIVKALSTINADDTNSFERASEAIQKAFASARMSRGMVASLALGWTWLGAHPVAVRSSATAEDLPQASFAGQQDTYLNITSEEALAKAVRDCWASLWTARAISYRTRNEIDSEQAELAVVVQIMAQATASGVMFTSNPVSGLRAEVVIDATLGLGEALVGGLVEPDHYVVAKGGQEIKGKSLGGKAIAVVSAPSGGVQEEHDDRSNRQALPDSAILKLARLGAEIEERYGFPQDVEWAYVSGPSSDQEYQHASASGKLLVLQSRAITSLYPVPDGLPASPARVLFSFAAVQGLLDPMTPLGMDAIRLIFAGGASLFGIRWDQHSQQVIRMAGERLWGDITGVIRHPLGPRVLPRIMGGVEPGSLPAVTRLLQDKSVQAGPTRIRPVLFWRLGRFLVPQLVRVLGAVLRPEHTAIRIHRNSQADIQALRNAVLDPANGYDLDHVLEVFRGIGESFVYAVPQIAVGALAGLIPLALLARISEQLTGSRDMALEITRGLPNNVTTQMDLTLWRTVQAIRADSASREFLQSNPPSLVARAFQQGDLPEILRFELQSFLDKYGMRGLGEIDIGRPRWGENPAPVIETLQSYLKIEQGPQAPDAVFRRGELAAERAIEELRTAARKTPLGRLKAAMIRGSARRVRALAGLRESPKFWIIQRMAIIRACLLTAGRKMAENGILDQPQDLFYLFLDELEPLADGDHRDWRSLIAERKARREREMRRRQIPRLLLSDGRVFYEGLRSSDGEPGQLLGSPVSPGSYEGLVRIVLDPHSANLQPGEILVCPGTDPAWTPLFLVAGGLVMELGGMMTHGAIVAREYGIPAVVGVDRATEHLETGQRIRIDGSSGQIQVLG